jgi:hypothetical protein
MRHHRSLIAAFAIAAAVIGCAAPAASRPAEPPAGPTAPPSLRPAPTATASVAAFDGSDAILVVGRTGASDLEAIQASTGDTFMRLPAGIPTSVAWGNVATTSISADRRSTTIGDAVVQPGGGQSGLDIAGAWHLPTIGYEPQPAGLSADGHTLVLIPAGDGADAPDRTTSRFAIVPFPPGQGTPNIIELPGALDYDAISPDGRILYVAEHLDGTSGGGYQVRAIDLPAGVMRDVPIVDKRNLDEAMAGWPIDQLRSPGGMVLTLYRGPEHPFIHALNTTEAWAACIDLPAGDDDAAQRDWGLAASADWRTAVAVNATRQLAVEIDMSELVARRTVSLATAAHRPVIELAKFGHIDGGPVGERVVASADGSAIFAAGPDGIVALAAPELRVSGRFLAGTAVEGLGLEPDGETLFALLGSGHIVGMDSATGDVVGSVPGDGFDRLVAVMPWE